MTVRDFFSFSLCHHSGRWCFGSDHLFGCAVDSALTAACAAHPVWRGIIESATELVADYHIGVSLCDEQTMTRLNTTYRGAVGSTNVLSFWDSAAQDAWRAARAGHWDLGDVVLADAVVGFEAGQLGIRPDQHACRLVIHGTLHLLGYRHDSQRDWRVMQACEKRAELLLWGRDVLVA